MNIFGHEKQETAHMSDEDGHVDAPPSTTKSAAPRHQAEADAAVLAALSRKDRETAAELLIEGHAAAIGRTCMALLGSQTEAEDALQDSLLSALDGLSTFRGEGTLRSWLLSIARRRCARRLAERTRERETRQVLDAGSAAAALPTGEQLGMARRARRLLEEIKPTEREALVLRFAAELSFREVGAACGIDEAAARKRVSRGLSRLRVLLVEDES